LADGALFPERFPEGQDGAWPGGGQAGGSLPEGQIDGFFPAAPDGG
jgi:hypothetical protein